MPRPLPSPVAAALGLVPAVYDHVRTLPRKAVQLPVAAIGGTLTTAAVVRREYDDLTERGERLAARLRRESVDGTAAAAAQVAEAGSSVAERVTDAVDEVEDRVEEVVERTPFARAYDAVEDAVEDTVEQVADTAQATVSRIGGSALDNVQQARDDVGGPAHRTPAAFGSPDGRTAEAVGDTAAGGALADALTDSGADAAAGTAAPGGAAARVDDALGFVGVAGAGGDVTGAVGAGAGAAADTADTPEAERPKGVPTPRATQPDDTRVDTAASASVVEAVEEVVQQVTAEMSEESADQGTDGPVPAHDELPLPDYDHMTLGSLRGRLRSLTLEQLVQIRAYEKAHADRLPVVTMLDNRIAKLASDAGAEPSGPVSLEPAPEQRDRVQGTSAVSPATTNAPKINPPSQGVPTNPGQPR